MEGIRAAAIIYYDRATRGEKDLVKQYFNKFDVNRNGKITLQQYKNGVATHLSDANIFRKLVVNRDGTLHFDEIVCLYYMEKKLGLQKCAKCQDLLVGAYFSCLRCVEDGLDPECHLCCTCYHLGYFEHKNHGLSNFLDQHSMAKEMRKRTSNAWRDRGKKEWEELKNIAKSYYQVSSQEVKAKAHEFFNSMDIDGDGKVDLSEFLEFMKEEGYTRMENHKFFKELDMDGNGTLDFDEVMTVYYISKSGRPFCDECLNFIRGIYFSCVGCYRKSSKDSFNLCCDCYRSKKCYDHKHDGRAQFLDNFALLEAIKKDSQAKTSDHPLDQKARSLVTSSSQATRSPISSNTHAIIPVPPVNVIINNIVNHPPPIANFSNAVIRPPRQKHWASKLQALEAAALANVTTSLMCTIM